MGLSNFQINGTDFDGIYVKRDIFSKGGLWSWGINSSLDGGQLGDNTRTDRSSPVQTVAGGSNWKLLGGGRYHSTAIKTDGTLWLWGYNAITGPLGDNTRTSRSSPVQTVSGGNNWKQVSGGNSVTAAIKTDGTLWMWGSNSDGQLGDNSTTSRSSPVQTVSGGNNWKFVSCGHQHTSALKTDGTLWLWGPQTYGQLGDNTTTSRSSPVQTVSAGTDWKFIAAGFYHMTAIKTDGTLWAWGFNDSGGMGDNTSVSKSSPVQIYGGGTNWKSIHPGYAHTAAIKTDGTLWMWGNNGNGQLGDNTTVSKSSPVQTVAGGKNWKTASGGGGFGAAHTAAIKTDGTLWTWGINANGQLGDNTITSRSSPVQTVTGGTNWISVQCGEKHTIGIRDNYT